MTEEKKSWADIPSLDGMQMDWDYQPANPQGKRDSRRILEKELKRLFAVPCVPVKVATVNGVMQGIVQDLSEQGVALRLPKQLRCEQKVKVGFVLGEETIIAKGIVKHVQAGSLGYITGVSLLDLSDQAKRHISGIYSSTVLK